MVEAEFAGEKRSFALRPSRYGKGYETEEFGSLGDLAQRAARGLLGYGHVRHVLIHALAGPDNPKTLYEARGIVTAEMADKALAPFASLATQIITEAFAGPEEAA